MFAANYHYSGHNLSESFCECFEDIDLKIMKVNVGSTDCSAKGQKLCVCT